MIKKLLYKGQQTLGQIISPLISCKTKFVLLDTRVEDVKHNLTKIQIALCTIQVIYSNLVLEK